MDSFERRLADECGKLRADVRAEMGALRTEMQTAMNALRLELRSDFKVEVANVRADLLKWSFVSWVGQLAALVAIIVSLR